MSKASDWSYSNEPTLEIEDFFFFTVVSLSITVVTTCETKHIFGRMCMDGLGWISQWGEV